MSVFKGNTFDWKISYLLESEIQINFRPSLIKKKALKNQREYIDKMAARLKEVEREILELEGIADKAVREVKAEYSQQIKDLFLKKEELQEKVSKIQKASGDAWEDMKAGIELSWEVFNDSVKNAVKKTK